MLERYLLCRPQGGLNDIFCEIEKCYQYTILTKRKLLIDTNYHSNHYFKGQLSKYFYSRDQHLDLSPFEFRGEFLKMDVYPHFLKGKLNTYSAVWDEGQACAVESDDLKSITFDFSRDYQEQMLFYHQFGRGDYLSFNFLKKLTLTEGIKKIVLDRYAVIGGQFDAVHIRNTDLCSDIGGIINALKKIKPQKLFVATDDSRSLSIVLNEFSNTSTTIFNFSSILSANDVPLCKTINVPSNETVIRDQEAIADLMLLGPSNRLILSKLLENKTKVSHSGFGLLARDLFNSKRALYELIGCSDF